MFAECGKGKCYTYKLRHMILNSAKWRIHINSSNHQSQQTSVDGNDIKTFAKLSSDWTNENGSFKALYAMNRLRLPLIVDTIGRRTEQGYVIP